MNMLRIVCFEVMFIVPAINNYCSSMVRWIQLILGSKCTIGSKCVTGTQAGIDMYRTQDLLIRGHTLYPLPLGHRALFMFIVFFFHFDADSLILIISFLSLFKKVQVGKDQEKAQSEKDSHSKNRGGKKPK